MSYSNSVERWLLTQVFKWTQSVFCAFPYILYINKLNLPEMTYKISYYLSLEKCAPFISVSRCPCPVGKARKYKYPKERCEVVSFFFDLADLWELLRCPCTYDSLGKLSEPCFVIFLHMVVFMWLVFHPLLPCTMLIVVILWPYRHTITLTHIFAKIIVKWNYFREPHICIGI